MARWAVRWLIAAAVSLLLPVLTLPQARAAAIWTPAAPLATHHAGQTATLLNDGTVLVAGSTSAEHYDPATDTWRAAGTQVVYHSSHTATLLADGRVLIAGGFTPLNGTPVAELYDPATNSWTAAAPLSTPRIAHSAVRLPDGEALVIGGAPDEKNTGLATAERYDPRTDQWRTAGAMHTTRVGFTTTLLPDGKVLVAGGETVGGGVGTPLAVAELYDPATNAWMTTTPLPTPRSGQRAVLLMDGRVLLISDEVSEVLPRGHARVEQYFERSRLEYHPENAAPYNILLGQLGRHLHDPDPPAAPIPVQTYVPETGHNVAADFFQYWQANGGLAQFGYPISEEMPEQLADGQTYTVQYFERARFERHPENPPPWAIELGQLGRGALAAERH